MDPQHHKASRGLSLIRLLPILRPHAHPLVFLLLRVLERLDCLNLKVRFLSTPNSQRALLSFPPLQVSILRLLWSLALPLDYPNQDQPHLQGPRTQPDHRLWAQPWPACSSTLTQVQLSPRLHRLWSSVGQLNRLLVLCPTSRLKLLLARTQRAVVREILEGCSLHLRLILTESQQRSAQWLPIVGSCHLLDLVRQLLHKKKEELKANPCVQLSTPTSTSLSCESRSRR